MHATKYDVTIMLIPLTMPSSATFFVYAFATDIFGEGIMF